MFAETKPISVGIIYKLPSQSQFLQQMITESEAVDLDNEIYVLGNFNINVLFRDKYVLNKSKGITKLCTQLHPAPPSSLQHPQQYLNENIARNWAISPNLGQKSKSCSFLLKFDMRGILEVLIPNPELVFEIPFLGKPVPKNSKLFVLSENWCIEYLKDADSESGLRFL